MGHAPEILTSHSGAQGLARVTSAKSVSSIRKFDKYGDWHYAAMLFRFGFWYLFAPHRMDEFAHDYWYGKRS
jgi:hypothetical protein